MLVIYNCICIRDYNKSIWNTYDLNNKYDDKLNETELLHIVTAYDKID